MPVKGGTRQGKDTGFLHVKKKKRKKSFLEPCLKIRQRPHVLEQRLERQPQRRRAEPWGVWRRGIRLAAPQDRGVCSLSARGCGCRRGSCCLLPEGCCGACHGAAAAGCHFPPGQGLGVMLYLNTECVREKEVPSNCSRAQRCSRLAANWCQRGCVLPWVHRRVQAGCRGCPDSCVYLRSLHLPSERFCLTRGGIRRILFRRLLEMDF